MKKIYYRNLKNAEDAHLQSIQALVSIFKKGNNYLVPFDESILNDSKTQLHSLQLKKYLDNGPIIGIFKTELKLPRPVAEVLSNQSE